MNERDWEPAEVVRPMGNALPDVIARQGKFFYIKRGGVRLRIMLAKTTITDPKGSIIFCPGRTEFIEKYFESIEDLLARGFHVLIMDPRGQGLSDRLLDDRLKSYVENFQDYADDLSYAADLTGSGGVSLVEGSAALNTSAPVLAERIDPVRTRRHWRTRISACPAPN